MARRMDTTRTSFQASPVGLRIARLGKNRVRVLVRTAEEDVLQNCKRPADSNGPWRISRSAQNLKPAWRANRVIACTDPDLCRTGLAQRKGLDRGQSG